jgi:hypothetical protein
MSHALVFVLGPESLLPGDGAQVRDLVDAQMFGLRSGVSLRIFRSPAGWEGQLDDLVGEGKADALGLDPFGSAPDRAEPLASPPTAPGERRRLLCDAVVPHFEPRTHWLGVYELNGSETTDQPYPLDSLPGATVRCLDRFPLREAENETCWFYPTEDGRYLSWENQRRLETLPGYLPERPLQEDAPRYERSAIHVLWSLMADDLALTCVGLTCGGRRIEWPLLRTDPEPFSTWTCFQIDSCGESSFQEISNITVFPA